MIKMISGVLKSVLLSWKVVACIYDMEITKKYNFIELTTYKSLNICLYLEQDIIWFKEKSNGIE